MPMTVPGRRDRRRVRDRGRRAGDAPAPWHQHAIDARGARRRARPRRARRRALRVRRRHLRPLRVRARDLRLLVRARASRAPAFVRGYAPSGTTRLLERDPALKDILAVHDATRRSRPGMVELDERRLVYALHEHGDDAKLPQMFVLHEGTDGVDGFAVYRVKHDWPEGYPRNVLTIWDLQATTPGRVRGPVAVRVRGRPGRACQRVEPSGRRAPRAPAAGAAPPRRDAPRQPVGPAGRRRRRPRRPELLDRRPDRARGHRPVLPVERAVATSVESIGGEANVASRRPPNRRPHVFSVNEIGADLPRVGRRSASSTARAASTSTPRARWPAPTRCSAGTRRPGARTSSESRARADRSQRVRVEEVELARRMAAIGEEARELAPVLGPVVDDVRDDQPPRHGHPVAEG